ncbi:Stk1 family PASTA domain-containing Ser/Thr kinase [Microbacterium sp.]|uniref:Stk1 family PASTA domain-containing Ser/Thr kinase n=1 Tax=Microbacterium sp. TaxID=51671 RepID=UPI003A8ADCF2
MSAESRVLSGRYRVDDLVGRGGMASVYRGYDLTLGRPVAIKVLKRDLSRDASFRTRFRLEAQAASRMSHPTIVRVYDAGEDTETDPDGSIHPVPYIVMELVHGQLLKDIIAEGPIPPRDVVHYADGILEALEYSHRAGVVHRDIKPGNIMITDAGQVKVMDFGIARAVSDSSSTVAETTAIIGTASYFSPEQAKGEPVDGRADLYSAGVVLYEMLTGVPPFRGETPVAVAYQHVSETPTTPSAVNDVVSRGLDAVVLRAMAKDPFQRFQDAASFREALDAAAVGKEPTKRTVGALTSELYGASPRQAADTARSLRQLSTDTTMRRTQTGPPVAWIWAGIAILAVLLISVLIWVLSIRPSDGVTPNARTVPDVVDASWDRARDALAAEDLVAVRFEEPSPAINEGNVTRTIPEAGVTVTPGQEIRVYVSTGQVMATVPDLTSMSRSEAAAALDDADLRLGSVDRVSDPSLPADAVMTARLDDGTTVDAGDELAVGTRIDLTVATGTVSIKDLRQTTTLTSATELLESDAYQLSVVREEDPGCPAVDPEIVVGQDKVGEVPIHSEVRLTVCSG